nr:sugar phosphate isomerase/epimerase [Rhodothermaceae bacterium]
QVAHYNMACSGLPAMPDDVPQDAVDAIKNAAAAHAVSLVGVSGTFNMIHPDVSIREAGLRRLKVLAQAAKAMDIPLITLCTGTRDPEDKWREHPDNDLPDAWVDLCTSMEEALEIADEYDILLGIEPELANVVNSTVKARRLMNEMASSRLRIVFDPANLFEITPAEEQRRLIEEGLDLLAGHVIMAHAKDRKSDGSFCAAGQGVIDFEHYINTLKSHGYDGPIVLHGLGAGDVRECTQFLSRVLSCFWFLVYCFAIS